MAKFYIQYQIDDLGIGIRVLDRLQDGWRVLDEIDGENLDEATKLYNSSLMSHAFTRVRAIAKAEKEARA